MTRPGAGESGIPVGLADDRAGVAFDDSLGDGVAGETGDVMDVELAHEMLPVFVHRLEGHAKFRGYLFVGLAFGNQLKNLDLPRTQAVVFLLRVPLSIQRRLAANFEALGDGGVEKGVSFWTSRMAVARTCEEVCFNKKPAAPNPVICST